MLFIEKNTYLQKYIHLIKNRLLFSLNFFAILYLKISTKIKTNKNKKNI